ncbi:hypothetical protein TWF696_001012 [Orbilia brochopaga]|uniref:C2H2-type domain-containing protein n=1 Tax=Orbilia brochopaga TaxID=3140254 RepID=A0AAV9VFM9_9PEZI
MASPQTPVSDLTRACISKFERCLQSRNITQKENLENRMADLSLWADGVGALAKQSASLDWRFRSRPEDLQLVKALLSMLGRFLDEYADIAETNGPIDDALSSIDAMIENLALIGVAVRRTGRTSRVQKADQKFNREMHSELRQHLECILLLRPSANGHKALDNSELTVVQKRLVDANLRRRNRFLRAHQHSRYLGNHQLEPSAPIEISISVPVPVSGNMTQGSLGPKQSPLPLPMTPRPIKGQGADVAGFSTASTAEGALQYIQDRSSGKEVAKTQITSLAADADYPRPPASASKFGHKVFRCPCCCQTLPNADTAEWRKHLVEDISPYTCIVEACPTPHLLFTTQKEWKKHIENDHPPQWQCPLCEDQDSNFPLVGEIVAHFRSHHADELSKDSLATLLSGSAVHCMGITECPLCTSSGPEDSPQLVDHVLRHVHDFSLRSLPWDRSDAKDLTNCVGTYKLPEGSENVAWLLNWLEKTELDPGASNELQLANFERSGHFGPESEPEDPAGGFDYGQDNYFADNPGDASTKAATDDQESRNLSSLPSGTGNSQTSSRSAVIDTEASTGDSTSESKRQENLQEAPLEGKSAIIQWLSKLCPEDHSSEINSLSPQRTPGTGQWFLDSVDFQAWLDQSKQILFCHGMPGAGKSMIASLVVDNLSQRRQGSTFESFGMAHMFFRRGSNYQDADQLLVHMLYQLTREDQSIPYSIQALYEQHSAKNTSPSTTEILSSLKAVATNFSRVFVVVDSIDAYVESLCRRDLGDDDFLSYLLELQRDAGVNLFVTSRFILPNVPRDATTLEIRATDEDLKLYIRSYIDNLSPDIRIHLPARDEIEVAILSVSDGMFSLAGTCLSLLGRQTSAGAIGRLLAGFVEREARFLSVLGSMLLDYQYRGIMNETKACQAYGGSYRGDDGVRRWASRVFNMEALAWIVYAKRPLTWLEIRYSILFDTGVYDDPEVDGYGDPLPVIRTMVSGCRGLVVADEESRIIRCVHYTVQDYLTRTEASWYPDAEVAITTTCVKYLSLEFFESGPDETNAELEERLRRWPLYDYAARYWGQHAGYSPTGPLLDCIMKFLRDEAKVEASAQAIFTPKDSLSQLRYIQGFLKRWTGFHLAAYFGIITAIKSLYDEGMSPNLVDQDEQPPLSIAAAQGHVDAVNILLEYAGLDINRPDIHKRTPLHLAAMSGHEAVVKILLGSAGVMVNCTDYEKWTPLSLACVGRHAGVVKALLENHNIDVNLPNLRSWTPLHLAAVSGVEAVVLTLLEFPGVEVNPKDNAQQTPLSLAAAYGYEDVVKLLLDSEHIDINWPDFVKRTPLHLAAANGYASVVQLLIERGAGINARDGNGETPLMSAASNGHKATVKILLDNGAPVRLRDKHGQTSLSLAASNGHHYIVQLLNDYERNID